MSGEFWVIKCLNCHEFSTREIRSKRDVITNQCRRCGKTATVKNKDGWQVTKYGPYDTTMAAHICNGVQRQKGELREARDN